MSKDEYQDLRDKVAQAQIDYHQHDKPTMSDYDYDVLLARLKDIEEKHPDWVTPHESPVENVGAPIKRGLYPVKHRVPMLSLDNVFTVADLQNVMDGWQTKDIDASYKYDGLAVDLTYLDHKLVEAATRGDRFEGESILHNVWGYDTIPKALPKYAPEELSVRGELLMFNDEFERYNERLALAKKPLAVNPRNAAAGLARRLRNEGQIGAQLVFMPYSVLYPNNDGPDTHGQSLAALTTYGFQMPWLPTPLTENGMQSLSLLDYINRRQDERGKLPFGIDGMVFRVNNYEHCNRLGTTSRAPRWAIAYKFPPEERTTVVRNIRLQIGRTGNATPVAEVDPVMVGGVTVTNATLHNEDQIKRLDIAIGDTVIIRRAGDVVPEIATVVHRPLDRVVWSFPEFCECGAALVRAEGQANHNCTGGLTCRFQVQRAFEHFVSRDAMDIDGVGPEIIAALLESGVLKTFDDLYRLKKEDLLAISTENSERFAENILQSIEKSRKTTTTRFIYALGIPQVGQTTAKRLADWFGRFEILRSASPILLSAVPDVGPLVAQSIYNYFLTHDQDRRLLAPGRIELQDQMGPCPEFVQYANVAELLKLAPIKGLPVKKHPVAIEKLKQYFGWPFDRENEFPTLPEEDEWLRAFYMVYRPTLKQIAEDALLVRTWQQEVRQINNNRPLVGNTYVITGSFDDTLGSRQKLTTELENLGAKVSGSVSAKTTAVFVGDSPGANKLDKAKSLGVPTLFVNDLRELLAKHSQ